MINLKEFQAALNKRVIGQEDAVKTITTSIFKYIMKLNARDFGCFFTGATSLLLVGPSGSGKTYIAQQAADIIDIPYIEINSKSISQEGWHGKSFLDLIDTGLHQARFDFQRQVYGAIIFIDEFDKLCMPNISSGKDDVNYHLQATLLKYIEGMNVQLLRSHLDFNKCLFILGGAFVGLELKTPKLIGFHDHVNKDVLLTEALIKFGVLPELAGRLQEFSLLNKLTRDDYIKILNSEHFSLFKWKLTLAKLGLTLDYDIDFLIQYAEKTELGARGLHQAVEFLVTEFINKNIDTLDLEKFTVLGSQYTTGETNTNIYKFKNKD